MLRTVCFFILLLGVNNEMFSQDISLFQQFNGRYDYTAIGNTLNPAENNIVQDFCEILPASQADLYLDTDCSIIAAYLYWAGSGTGDLEVSFNGSSITADNTYITDYLDSNYGTLNYFSCMADVTDQILAAGNTSYTFSDLDIANSLASNPGYCENRTNFAGWSLYVVYENPTLPLNQINLFQGLEIINRNVQEKVILLENVNVLDNEDAKIGFLAWEGDNALNYGESLSINGNIIANPPLNAADNAFNGTNSFTNSNTFYNGDLDVYNIENNIAIGDTSVSIKLTTGGLDANGFFQADLILLNNIITVLNSQLPDATITIDAYYINCGNRTLEIDYTVYNLNSTDILPTNTPIAFYANNTLIDTSSTLNTIAIGASETHSINIQIPSTIPDNFTLTIVVDDNGSSTGNVVEIIESNNTTTQEITLIPLPEIKPLQPLMACDISNNTAVFDITAIQNQINESYFNFYYFTSIEDLQAHTNVITLPNYYQSLTTPQTLYLKAETETCFDIYTFNVLTENCPPFIPEGFSPNNDGINDHFNIAGLYTIFEKHELLIYNRWGTLIFIGNNDLKWYGISNRGFNKGYLVPTGTYFYVLHLNDANYKSMTGWVYLNY
ncbi:T9SS type B sorting domain-containing protein [Bizionia gelidisalsuginis]|uniref:T9SS type B sorting domain-containing protein n=1 Tax=Bizionia gelidisalsuginis TaxID=291188 RepID=A0ABY3MDP0_9FLAO|nr:gliding motility-associated C-terminal domain-containing protein [Bizionia gelidisalsuginis]TYC17109.1 T9SS type B sorting domain-containing protein [Bizionia gelidisalsuginis]